MANSPLVIPGSTEKGTSTSNRSKLSTAAPSSNGATPEVAQNNNGAGRDLAEQMNEEEKQKYIKGHSHQQIPFTPPSF
jgi:cyclin-dependent kinase 7